MPYLGLLDNKGREISKPDYVRRNLLDVVFKMSPPRDGSREQIIFINNTDINFGPAKSNWGIYAMIGVFWEPAGDAPFCRSHVISGPHHVSVGEMVCVGRGMLAFGVHDLTFEK